MRDLKQLSILVEQLRKTNSTTSKMEMLKENMGCRKLLFYTYNDFYQYGVSPERCHKMPAHASDPSIEYDNVYHLLDDLRVRNLTGSRAVRACNTFAEAFPEVAEIFWSIIDRDLKCRIDTKMINKVWPGTIPTFDVALAESYADNKDRVKFDGSWFLSRKLDGVRVITLIRSMDDIKFYSRKGNEFTSLQVLRTAIEKLGVDLTGWVLDGELCIMEDGMENFTAAVSQIKRKNFIISHPKYMIFDMLRMDEFANRSSATPLAKRNSILHNNIKVNEHIGILQQIPLTESSFATYQEEFRKNGWEGLILRKNSPYVGKRSKDMLKVKDFHEAEFKVEAMEVGMKHILIDGKMQECEVMAAVFIDFKGSKVKVGSGWTDAERLEYLDRPEAIMGKTITVSYFSESKDADGKLSLRFPTVKAIHGLTREV